MVYDDLPFWGFIGKLEKLLKPSGTELKYYVFTHSHYDVAYNKDRVIEVKVTTDPSHTVQPPSYASSYRQIASPARDRSAPCHLPYRRLPSLFHSCRLRCLSWRALCW